MKILKGFAYFFVVVFVIYLVLCAMGDKTIEANESIVIDASQEQIYNNIADFKNHPKWGVWFQMDPDIKLEYEKNGVGVGAKSTWKSDHKQVGNGSQEFIELRPYEFIRTKMQFEGEENDAFGSFTFKPIDGKTEVTWIMEPSEIPFIGRGALYLMDMNSVISTNFKDGLANLKKIMEE